MGLDTSHDCWHGSYSRFSLWRNAIEAVAGIPQREFTDGTGYRWFGADINWDAYEEKNFQGEWDKWPDDPLLILIVHSDCDGKIPTVHCAPLADRLEQLLPKLSEHEDRLEQLLPKLSEHGEREWCVKKTEQFIKGLRYAAERGEDVDFN